MGGLDFGSAPKNVKVDPKEDIVKTSLPSIVKEIRRRVHARIALVRQVLELGTKNIRIIFFFNIRIIL